MSERGSITLWVLGAMMALLVVGLFATEVSIAFAARRTVAAVADSAAAQAAEMVDTSSLGDEPRLDVERARSTAIAAVSSHPMYSPDMRASVSVDPDQVLVEVGWTTGTGPVGSLVGIADHVVSTTGVGHPRWRR